MRRSGGGRITFLLSGTQVNYSGCVKGLNQVVGQVATLVKLVRHADLSSK